MTCRQEIVTETRSWLGTPYQHQASLKGVGCDCLGLVRGVWRAVIGPEPEELPAYTPDWAEAGGEETLLDAAARHLIRIPLNQAAPGDVLLFRWNRHAPTKHAAILVAPDRMIHAYERACVLEAPLSAAWMRQRTGAFRFPGVID